MLYELIGGKRAFTGESAASVSAGILERDPARLDLVPALERVITTCLAKDPDQRFQNALDLKRDLDWAMEQAPTTKAARPSMLPWIVACACLVATGGAVMLLRNERASGVPIRFPIALPGFSWTNAAISTPVPSPDGTQIAFLGQDAAAIPSIHIRRFDSETATRLEGTEGDKLRRMDRGEQVPSASPGTPPMVASPTTSAGLRDARV